MAAATFDEVFPGTASIKYSAVQFLGDGQSADEWRCGHRAHAEPFAS
jgi:hypothetical protein